MSTDPKAVKVVQVPMPLALLEAVTHYARQQGESRAAFIRHVLERYLARPFYGTKNLALSLHPRCYLTGIASSPRLMEKVWGELPS